MTNWFSLQDTKKLLANGVVWGQVGTNGVVDGAVTSKNIASSYSGRFIIGSASGGTPLVAEGGAIPVGAADLTTHGSFWIE